MIYIYIVLSLLSNGSTFWGNANRLIPRSYFYSELVNMKLQQTVGSAQRQQVTKNMSFFDPMHPSAGHTTLLFQKELKKEFGRFDWHKNNLVGVRERFGLK